MRINKSIIEAYYFLVTKIAEKENKTFQQVLVNRFNKTQNFKNQILSFKNTVNLKEHIQHVLSQPDIGLEIFLPILEDTLLDTKDVRKLKLALETEGYNLVTFIIDTLLSQKEKATNFNTYFKYVFIDAQKDIPNNKENFIKIFNELSTRFLNNEELIKKAIYFSNYLLKIYKNKDDGLVFIEKFLNHQLTLGHSPKLFEKVIKDNLQSLSIEQIKKFPLTHSFYNNSNDSIDIDLYTKAFVLDSNKNKDIIKLAENIKFKIQQFETLFNIQLINKNATTSVIIVNTIIPEDPALVRIKKFIAQLHKNSSLQKEEINTIYEKIILKEDMNFTTSITTEKRKLKL